IQEIQSSNETPRGQHRRQIRRLMVRQRHVFVHKRAEQLGQERLLPNAEERTFESVRAQKAEPIHLGDQVLSGPHLRRSPEEANGGLAKKLQYSVSHPEVLLVELAGCCDLLLWVRRRLACGGW